MSRKLIASLILLLGSSARADFCESHAESRRAWRSYTQEWKDPAAAVSDVNLITVGERFPTLAPRSYEKRPHLFNKEMFRVFLKGRYRKNLPSGPLEVTDFLFEIPLFDGSRHEIHVVMIPGHGELRNLSDAAYATYLVANLPWLTLRATRFIELTPQEPLKSDAIRFARGEGDYKGNIYLYVEAWNKDPRADLETLLHEHGHNVGYALDIGPEYAQPYPSFWKNIMAADSFKVSTHTPGPVEDFAQSFAIYFQSRGAIEHRAGLAHHFHFFDLLYSQARQGLVRGTYWELVRQHLEFRAGVQQRILFWSGVVLSAGGSALGSYLLR